MALPPVLLPLPGFEPLAATSGLEIAPPIVERFANGELSIRLPALVEGRDCILLGTAAAPADQLVSLLLAAHSLVRHGAGSVRAVMPYLAYARQDRLEPGRSLAAGWLGSVLAASGVEDVVAIDVHSEAARELIGLPVTSLSPAPLFARELGGIVTSDTVVVAPDQGAIERTLVSCCRELRVRGVRDTRSRLRTGCSQGGVGVASPSWRCGRFT